MKRWPLLILLALVAGCQVGQLPDPNDPINGGNRAGDLLRKKMRQASDLVNERVAAREISPPQGEEILAVQAGEELDRIKSVPIPDDKAWEFAEVALTARRWKEAKALLTKANAFNAEHIKRFPEDLDRYVNDTLRLAHAEAGLGDLDAAIKTTRSVFDVPTKWRWPILYAVYLEIVPTAVRTSPGHELVLAQLIEDAIKEHLTATGDAADPHFTGWVTARQVHVRTAWIAASKLYQAAGKPDLAAKAMQNAQSTPHPVRV
jgi:hypothetical protein